MKKIDYIMLCILFLLILSGCSNSKSIAPQQFAFFETNAGKSEAEMKEIIDLIPIENPLGQVTNLYEDPLGRRYIFRNGYFISMMSFYEDQEKGFQECMEIYTYIKKKIGLEKEDPMGGKTLKDLKKWEDLKEGSPTMDGSYWCGANWRDVKVPDALESVWDELYTGERILVLEMRSYEDEMYINIGYAGLPLSNVS